MKGPDVCDLLSNNFEKVYRVNCGEMLTVVNSRMFLSAFYKFNIFQKKKKKSYRNMSLTIILADASLGFIYCPLGQALTRQDTTAPKMGRLGNDLCFLLCSTVLLVTVKLIASNEKH